MTRTIRTLIRRLSAAGNARSIAAAHNNLTPERMAAWRVASARCERLRNGMYVARAGFIEIPSLDTIAL
jgi:hypothetical protein